MVFLSRVFLTEQRKFPDSRQRARYAQYRLNPDATQQLSCVARATSSGAQPRLKPTHVRRPRHHKTTASDKCFDRAKQQPATARRTRPLPRSSVNMALSDWSVLWQHQPNKHAGVAEYQCPFFSQSFVALHNA